MLKKVNAGQAIAKNVFSYVDKYQNEKRMQWCQSLRCMKTAKGNTVYVVVCRIVPIIEKTAPVKGRSVLFRLIQTQMAPCQSLADGGGQHGGEYDGNESVENRSR